MASSEAENKVWPKEWKISIEAMIVVLHRALLGFFNAFTMNSITFSLFVIREGKFKDIREPALCLLRDFFLLEYILN